MSNYTYKMPVANLITKFLDEYKDFKSTDEILRFTKCWHAYEALSSFEDIRLYDLEDYVVALSQHCEKIVELRKYIGITD